MSQKLFANLGLGYLITIVVYLVVTSCYGTPFKHALMFYPELQYIKRESSRRRSRAFYFGVMVAVAVLNQLPFRGFYALPVCDAAGQLIRVRRHTCRKR